MKITFIGSGNVAWHLSDVLQKNGHKIVEVWSKSEKNAKLLRAKEEFAFLIFNNPGSKYAIDSQFYYAECLFHLKNYSDAIKEYQKYISISKYKVYNNLLYRI